MKQIERSANRTACVQEIVLELDARLRGHDTVVTVELALIVDVTS